MSARIKNPDEWGRGRDIAATLRDLADRFEAQDAKTTDAENGWVKADIKLTFATDAEMDKARARIARKAAKNGEGGNNASL